MLANIFRNSWHARSFPPTLIFLGFFGFLGACLIWAGADLGGWTNIYGAPATLSSFAFNTLMGLAGGMIGEGKHVLSWSGINSKNKNVPSGNYLLIIDNGATFHSQKIILLK